MSKFGWDLPPGVTQRMIDEAMGSGDAPCECCGLMVDGCICPECPQCSAAGDPRCYRQHGLQYTREQLDGQDRRRIAELEDRIVDIKYAMELRNTQQEATTAQKTKDVLPEGMVRKGGRNIGASQITERPLPPLPLGRNSLKKQEN
jgi:hypothetical protein